MFPRMPLTIQAWCRGHTDSLLYLFSRNGKRTVLVAALSTYAELLASSTARLDLEQGKGKGKASDDDVDLKAEIEDQLKLCGEVTSYINNPTFGKDFAETFERVELDSSESLSNQLKEALPFGKARMMVDGGLTPPRTPLLRKLTVTSPPKQASSTRNSHT
jgi:hypothetical protein